VQLRGLRSAAHADLNGEAGTVRRRHPFSRPRKTSRPVLHELPRVRPFRFGPSRALPVPESVGREGLRAVSASARGTQVLRVHESAPGRLLIRLDGGARLFSARRKNLEVAAGAAPPPHLQAPDLEVSRSVDGLRKFSFTNENFLNEAQRC
jgi:hypothetical protein